MRHFCRLTIVAAGLVTLTGCGLIYTDVRVPRAYRTATPSDVKASTGDRTVSGQACYQSLLYLVAWGDASYAAATASALGGDGAAVLYDVRADVKATSYVFGLYSRWCTIVTGRVGSP